MSSGHSSAQHHGSEQYILLDYQITMTLATDIRGPLTQHPNDFVHQYGSMIPTHSHLWSSSKWRLESW